MPMLPSSKLAPKKPRRRLYNIPPTTSTSTHTFFPSRHCLSLRWIPTTGPMSTLRVAIHLRKRLASRDENETCTNLHFTFVCRLWGGRGVLAKSTKFVARKTPPLYLVEKTMKRPLKFCNNDLHEAMKNDLNSKRFDNGRDPTSHRPVMIRQCTWYLVSARGRKMETCTFCSSCVL